MVLDSSESHWTIKTEKNNQKKENEVKLLNSSMEWNGLNGIYAKYNEKNGLPAIEFRRWRLK